jgi:hypothetical protein
MNIESMSLSTKELPVRLQGSPSTAYSANAESQYRLHDSQPWIPDLFLDHTHYCLLQGTLLRTYKRYKADTDRVIRCLVNNSRYNVKADVSTNILPELAWNVPPDHNSENVLRILNQVIQARTECVACAVQVQKSPRSLRRDARALRQHS